MASDPNARRAVLAWPARPPAGLAPCAWDLVTDGGDAIWWHWLAIPPGTSPSELDACWFCLDDLGMGLGFYVPRRLGAPERDVSRELLNVVRLVDLEGWSRRKTGRRLYPDALHPKAAVRTLLREGREQLAVLGVLPWAAWPSGELPRDWWTQADTHVAIGAWRAAAAIAREDPGTLRRVAGRVMAVARSAPQATAEGAWAAVARRLAA